MCESLHQAAETLYRDFQIAPRPRDDAFNEDRQPFRRLLTVDLKEINREDFLGFLDSRSSDKEIFYFMPRLLVLWQDGLQFSQDWFAEQLNEKLAHLNFMHSVIPKKLVKPIKQFTRPALIERVKSESSLHIDGMSPTHRWPNMLASYGVWTDDIPYVWESIWESNSHGHAIAVIQYSSCLACKEGANPVFQPFSPHRGGGPPLLWEYDSQGFGESWRPGNIAYIEDTLSVEYIQHHLQRMEEYMQSNVEREALSTVLNEVRIHPKRVRTRCKQLISFFQTPNNWDTSMDWE